MVFCENCRDEIDYSIENKKMTSNIKGWVIEYIGKFAYCDICKNEVFVPEIRDYNLRMLESSFYSSPEFKNGLK